MATQMNTKNLLADISTLRGIIDAVPNAVFVKDRDSRFLVVNRAMCRLMGRTFDELVGRFDTDFVPAEQAAVFRAVDLAILETGDPNENEEHITDGSGELRTIITRKQALDLPDGTRLIVGCITDITEFRRAEQMIRYNAEHDHLTGLANRALFQRLLREAILQLQPGGEAISLLLIDLDGFKGVNDRNGHAAGDEVLVATARTLSDLVAAGDVVARLGGDEFAIIQLARDQPATAVNLARKIVDRLAEPIPVMGRHVVVSASVGIAIVPADPLGDDTLLRRADIALYGAKRNGRNTWRLFEPEMEGLQILV
ncbi:MAG TPA: GGDEF domain-containing protein [Bauldia sp.]|nr:GGDEF domain-containing protein [Bauldia sp.]